jgi:hypothetical protein
MGGEGQGGCQSEHKAAYWQVMENVLFKFVPFVYHLRSFQFFLHLVDPGGHNNVS